MISVAAHMCAFILLEYSGYITITGTSLEVEHQSYMTCHSTLHIIWFMSTATKQYHLLLSGCCLHLMQHCVTMAKQIGGESLHVPLALSYFASYDNFTAPKIIAIIIIYGTSL